MTELDILSIDIEIKDKFRKEEKNLPLYCEKIDLIKKTIEIFDLSHRIREDLVKEKTLLKTVIEDINNKKPYNFYIMESTPVIEEYRKILKKPLVQNFMGRSQSKNSEKRKIIDEYLKISQKYVHLEIKISPIKNVNVCKNCKNKKNFDIIDSEISICIECGAQENIIIQSSSYKDIDRVNISTKYTYDRSVHFRDCIKQYQGKQNSTIAKEVYDDLEEQFDLHGLLVGDKNTIKETRFRDITRAHINLFLKETDHSKHYEDIILIHYNMTGKKPDDISHLEDFLLDDFEILTNLYDKKFIKDRRIDRKNFINTQYVLFQLLRRRKYPCKKEDFNTLKTIDRKSFHDDICRELFRDLGWNFTPCF